MAWCYYCRRYTVNGQCPDCGRIYEFPGKKYDFYGKEIKDTSKSSSSRKSSSSSSYKSSSSSSYASYELDERYGSFAVGFWLALAISFGSIIIASKKEKPNMKRGAIIGTIVWGIVILHAVTILLAVLNENINLL